MVASEFTGPLSRLTDSERSELDSMRELDSRSYDLLKEITNNPNKYDFYIEKKKK